MHFPLNLFDLLLGAFVLAGAVLGRKSGFASQLPSTLGVLLAVVVAAGLYAPAGDIINDRFPELGHLSADVLAYATIGSGIFFLVGSLCRPLRARLIENDSLSCKTPALGAALGVIRFASFALAVVALLNARLYTYSELRSVTSTSVAAGPAPSIPTLYLFQTVIFQHSFSGHWLAGNLPFLLIRATPAYEPSLLSPGPTHLEEAPFNFIDLLLGGFIALGLARSKTTCLSSEFARSIKWLGAVCVAGFAYIHVAKFVKHSIPALRWLPAYGVAYLAIAFIVLLAFTRLEFTLFRLAAWLEPKLTHIISGQTEDALARGVKLLRFACIGLIPLALLHARLYTSEEVEALNQSQVEAFGNRLFPTLFTLQTAFFQNSWSGRMLSNNLGLVLIHPTSARD